MKVISMVTGRTFKRRENSKFSFSYQFYFAYGFPYTKNEFLGTTDFIQNASLNLTAVYDKMYVGIGATERPIRNASLFAGYQSKTARLGISYGWKVDVKPLETNRAMAGLSAAFFFPK